MTIVTHGIVKCYERNGVYPMSRVTELIGEERGNFDGDIVKTSSDRYKLFAKNSCCVRCGIEGLYYAKERMVKFNKKDGSWRPTSEGFHFNLYATKSDGSEVMITKDHIIPKSKGGPDNMSNYQTMCFECNVEKGDKHV